MFRFTFETQVNNMSGKNKKQIGVWMDSQNAIVLGKKNTDTGDFIILGHAKNVGSESNSNENAANNSERTELQKFFKAITAYMQNAEEVHVTGTGTAQEQFIKHLAETPQFKNIEAKESTSKKMSDDKLIEYISEKFN